MYSLRAYVCGVPAVDEGKDSPLSSTPKMSGKTSMVPNSSLRQFADIVNVNKRGHITTCSVHMLSRNLCRVQADFPTSLLLCVID